MKAAADTINRRRRNGPKEISASKGTEPALAQEYEIIFTNNGKPMVIVEADTTISLANAEFERLSGYTKEEIEGNKRWTEFVAREDRKRMREYHLLRKSDPMLAPRCCEFRFIDRDGKVTNVVLTIGQIPGTNKSMASLQDVTDRKRAEATQRVGEERYKTLFENSRDAIYITTRDGAYIDANRAALELFGYTSEEMKRVRARQLYANPADARRLRKEIEERGFAQDFEARLRKKDGREMDCLLAVTAQRADDKSIVEYQCIVRDITERKRAEEALRESEGKYRDIFDSMLEGYFEVDLAGNFTFFNKAVSKFFGYPRDELMGLNYRDFTSPEEAQRLFQIFSEVFTAGNPHEIDDYEIIKKDGSLGIAEFSVSLLRDAVGKPIGFRGVTRDVTEKRKVEKASRESEERYRTILENIEDGYYETDLDGNYTFVNETVCKHHNRSREELLSMNNRDHASPETVKRLRSIFTEIYRTGVPAKIVDNEVIRKDGTTKLVEISASLLRNDSGKPIGFCGISRDRTEQKKAEEALRQSEEKYRGILESIEDGYAEMDFHGTIIFSNDALSRILGYPKDALKSLTYKNRQYMDEENAERVYQAYTEIYNTGQPNRGLQYEIIAQDGTRRSLESSVSLRKDAGGKPVGFQGVVRDITERKQIEETLRESEERYRSILDIIGDAYTENDLAGHMTFLNKESFKFLGWSGEEFIGMSYKDYTTPENAKKLFEIYSRVYKTGEPARLVEYELIAKDGTTKIAEATVELIRDKAGKPIGFRTLTRDITQRKQMEEALRQSEERYRTIIENIQDGYYEIDLAGRFTFINDVVCRHLGYSKEELFEMDNRELQDEAAAKKVYEFYKEIYERGEPITLVEAEYIRKDGTKGIYELSASLIRDAKGKPIGFRGISRDVTERKKAEEQLQRYAEELERSNEEVKNFAYIVSHDLRVPLVNLKGYTSELRSALGVVGSNFDAALPQLDEEKRSEVALALHEDVPEALEFITSSVSRMDNFINAVLILSRLGRRELKPEPLDMEAVVQMSLENLSHQIQEHGIEVTVGPLPEVVADRTAMEQIVGNILGNAVKYIDPERPAKITVTAKPNNTETTFRIQDTGRGIAQEDMHKVFAPFRRAGKQDTPGEGMGLAYVQTLVRRHGGRIWCESEVGKGTTFTFTIAKPSGATPSGKGAHDA